MAVARDGGPAPTLDFRPTAAARDRARPHAVKFQLANIVQRLQPNLHRWDRDTVTSVDSLKEVTDWEPRFDFDAAVEATYEWWQGAPESEVEHDFGWEDEILAML
jgi:nucleoside-diphosphate-sugar epimerase